MYAHESKEERFDAHVVARVWCNRTPSDAIKSRISKINARKTMSVRVVHQPSSHEFITSHKTRDDGTRRPRKIENARRMASKPDPLPFRDEGAVFIDVGRDKDLKTNFAAIERTRGAEIRYFVDERGKHLGHAHIVGDTSTANHGQARSALDSAIIPGSVVFLPNRPLACLYTTRLRSWHRSSG